MLRRLINLSLDRAVAPGLTHRSFHCFYVLLERAAQDGNRGWVRNSYSSWKRGYEREQRKPGSRTVYGPWRGWPVLSASSSGVEYHSGHVWWILRQKLGWSCQRPVGRARERNEAAIRDWKENIWPALKKKPKKRAGSSSS